MKRLGNFAAFTNRFFGQPAPDNKLYVTRTFDVRGARVGVAGLNTALFSGSPGGDDSLVLGRPQVERALDELRGADLRVALLHHPVHALADAGRVADLLARFDLVLHGHVHAPDLRDAAPVAVGGAIHAGAPPLLKDQPPHAYSLLALGPVPHVEIRQLEPGTGRFARRAWLPLPPTGP
jgi:hypothetical protein